MVCLQLDKFAAEFLELTAARHRVGEIAQIETEGSCHSLIVVGHCRKYQTTVFARVRAAVGYLRGLPLVSFEVAANAPGHGLLDVDHCAGLVGEAVMFLIIDIGSKLCPAEVVSERNRLPEATSHRVISPCLENTPY